MNLDDLAAPDRALVHALTPAGVDPARELQLMLRQGCSVEEGRFVRLVLRDPLYRGDGLDLDLRPLSALRELKVGRHRGLRALDLRGLRALATLIVEDPEHLAELRCADNPALTRLELRWVPALTRLPELPGLRHLQVRGCPELLVDPGPLRHLVTLVADRTPPTLDLRQHEALEHLEIKGAGLTSVQLPPSVRYLDLRGNALTQLDPGPHLEKLCLDDNPIEGVDLTGCPGLLSLYASHTALRQLDTRANPKLRRLEARGLHLGALDLHANPRLAYVDVRHSNLKQLTLPTSGELVVLHVDGNALRSLSLEGQTGLQVLRCEKNPLKELDLRPCTWLGRVELGRRRLEVLATDAQKHRCAALRKLFGLGSGKRGAATMNRYELHDWSARFNWDDGLGQLFTAVKRPDCDLATALRIYWMGKPYWYCQWRDVEDQRRKDTLGLEGHELLALIEERVRQGRYEALIPFDPANDEGEDWTAIRYEDVPKVREPPAMMFEATVGGERVAGFVPRTLN